jgi:two-component sensor histidine kinase
MGFRLRCTAFCHASTLPVVLLYVLFVVFAGPVSAQTPRFTTYTTANGLPSNSLTRLEISDDGSLFIGANEGFVVHDGYSFEVYQDTAYAGQVNEVVQSRFHPSRMYLSVYGRGVLVYETGRQPYLIDGGKHRWAMSSVAEISADSLLCSTEKGLKIWDGKSYQPYALPGDFAPLSDDVYRIRHLDNRRFVLGTETSALMVDLKSQQVIAAPELFNRRSVNLLHSFDGDGRALMICFDGMIRAWHPDSGLEDVFDAKNAGVAYVNAVGDALWLSTYSRSLMLLGRNSAGKWTVMRQYPAAELGTFSTYTAAVADREGNVWLASTGSGLLKTGAHHARVIRKTVTGFTQWSGEWNNGFFSIGSDSIEWHSAGGQAAKRSWPNPRGSSDIRRTVAVGGKTVYMNTPENEIVRIDLPEPGGKATVTTVVPDRGPAPFLRRADSVVVSRSVKTYYVFDHRKTATRRLRRFQHPDTVPGNPLFYALRSDGTLAGIDLRGRYRYRFEPSGDTMAVLFEHLALPERDNDFVTAYAIDAKNREWVGTHQTGIWMIDTAGTAYRVLYDSLQTHRRINDMLALPDGRIAFASIRSVGLIDPERQPLRSEEFPHVIDDMVLALGAVKDGFLAVTNTYAMVIPLVELIPQSLPGPVRISKILVDGAYRSPQPLLELEPGVKSVNIVYGLISHTRQGALRFQYRMSADKPWISAGTNRSLLLTELAPGRHSIEIRAGIRGSDAFTQPVGVVLVQKVPFTQSPAFILLLLGLVAVVLYAGIRIYYVHLLRIERIRSRLAADMHDDIGSGLSRINLLIRKMLMPQLPEQERQQIARRVMELSQSVSDAVGEVIWSLDPKHDTPESTWSKLEYVTQQFLSDYEVEGSLHRDPALEHINVPAEVRLALILIMKEALNNIQKYSGATHIAVRIEAEGIRTVRLTVEDNGKGFDFSEAVVRGNGLNNMKRRAEQAGGTLVLRSSPGKGTTVTARLPAV